MDASNPWRRLPFDAPVAVPHPVVTDEVVALHVPPHDGVPNHPRWAALLYPAALADDRDIDRIDFAKAIENSSEPIWSKKPPSPEIAELRTIIDDCLAMLGELDVGPAPATRMLLRRAKYPSAHDRQSV